MEETKEKNRKRIISIIGLLILIIGVSYAYWNNTVSQKTTNVVKSGCLKLEISDETEAINLSDAYPISDEEAENLSPYTFRVTNSCNTNAKFDINLEILETEDKLASKYIAIKYNNQEKEILGDKEKAELIETEEYQAYESYYLESDILKGKETKEYTIKLWMDENVSDIEAMEKTFESKIAIKAGMITGEILTEKVNVGDYVKMTPTKTTYTISGDATGCTDATYCNGVTNQTINPSRLDLWRVIKKNEDGTIELVSENVSSEDIFFYGQTGYLNYVGALNEIASSYENPKYTIGSRYMGYNGQTEYITDTFTATVPWLTNTEDHKNQYEPLGGGDNLYQSDLDLVQNALGTLSVNKNTTTIASSYWVASRSYIQNVEWYVLDARRITENGELALNLGLYNYNVDSSNNFISNEKSNSLRPIIILKKNLDAKGNGTSASPWVLS